MTAEVEDHCRAVFGIEDHGVAYGRARWMPIYRVDFLDSGTLRSSVELQEDDDAAAIQHAHRINIPSMGGRFEVWHGTRLIYQHRN